MAGEEEFQSVRRRITISEQQTDVSATDVPAVGLIGAGCDEDALLREVLRALQRGYPVLVAHDRSLTEETVHLLDGLGVTIISQRGVEQHDRPLREDLIHTARMLDYPRLLVHTVPSVFVDYAQSRSRMEASDRFAVDASTTARPGDHEGGDVLVAVPAYNEAATIGDVVANALDVSDDLLIVDDGSDDETGRIAAEAGAAVIEHDRNRGYGAALKTAFITARQRNIDHLVVVDGDGQHDPDDVPKLVERQRESGAELVIGSRFVEGASTNAPLYRRVGLRVINTFANLSLGVVRPSSRIADTQSGFRVYDRRAIESLAADGTIGDGMWASTDILYHAHRMNYAIEEVPTTIEYDVENGSTRNPIAHGYTLIRNLVRTIERDRPITVLGVPGFLCTLFGFSAGYWTVSNYVQTETFPLGLGLLTIALVLAGLLTCFVAIVLHALNTLQLSSQPTVRTEYRSDHHE